MAEQGSWEQMGPSDSDALAKAWLADLRASSPPPDGDPGQQAAASDVGQAVVLMNFTAGPDQQWQFICSAVAHAQSDDELGHIAAGPVEHLLGWHGSDFIARVEAQAAADDKLRGC